jgi:16S rRNA (uracil1498-N3)-methyltransferase
MVAFLVGPEGGWSPDEEQRFDDMAKRNPEKIHCVSLGTSVLRAETAAMTAIAAYSLCCGGSDF